MQRLVSAKLPKDVQKTLTANIDSFESLSLANKIDLKQIAKGKFVNGDGKVGSALGVYLVAVSGTFGTLVGYRIAVADGVTPPAAVDVRTKGLRHPRVICARTGPHVANMFAEIQAEAASPDAAQGELRLLHSSAVYTDAVWFKPKSTDASAPKSRIRAFSSIVPNLVGEVLGDNTFNQRLEDVLRKRVVNPNPPISLGQILGDNTVKQRLEDVLRKRVVNPNPPIKGPPVL
jgi:hypothetical protein